MSLEKIIQHDIIKPISNITGSYLSHLHFGNLLKLDGKEEWNAKTDFP